MKLISVILLSLWSLIAMAERTESPAPQVDEKRIAQEKRNMQILAEMGLPLPGSGIKIVPRAALGRTEEELKKAQQDREDMAKQGYINSYTTRPKELLNLKKEAKRELRSFGKQKHSPQYTGMSPTVNDLKLAFKFKGIKEHKELRALNATNAINMLGAAPQGGFHKDKGGWSGAAQFFDVKDIGTCDYSMMNVKASNTAAQLAEEDITYYVNKKPTINLVEGNPESGFLYRVEWYDNDNFHELICANMNYSSDINTKVIELAVKLDK